MRKILLFLIFVLQANFSLAVTADQAIAQCKANGIDYLQYKTFVQQLLQAIKRQDISGIANLMHYPLRVNADLREPYLILNKKEFIRNYSRIFSKEMRQDILDMNSKDIPMCNWQGMGIGGGLWVNTFGSEIKVYVINYFGKESLNLTREGFGAPVEPITDKKQLAQFIQLLHKNNLAINNDYTYLKISEEKGKSGLYAPTGCNKYNLYRADISNDEQDEYVLTATSCGTMRGAYVDNVFKIDKDKLSLINFQNIIGNNLGVDQEQWYMYLGNPFIVFNQGKYYLRYFNMDPAAFCIYLWEGNKFNLIKGPSACIGSKL